MFRGIKLTSEPTLVLSYLFTLRRTAPTKKFYLQILVIFGIFIKENAIFRKFFCVLHTCTQKQFHTCKPVRPSMAFIRQGFDFFKKVCVVHTARVKFSGTPQKPVFSGLDHEDAVEKFFFPKIWVERINFAP